jgi:hypothetical protein
LRFHGARIDQWRAGTNVIRNPPSWCDCHQSSSTTRAAPAFSSQRPLPSGVTYSGPAPSRAMVGASR